jgi:hypothetical protein
LGISITTRWPTDQQFNTEIICCCCCAINDLLDEGVTDDMRYKANGDRFLVLGNRHLGDHAD